MKGNHIQRTFIIGEEWLYYKIYCGARTADIILLDVIKPLTEKLLHEKIINKWFFIRYSDPDSHIRFRVQLIDLNNLGKVLLIIKRLLKPYIDTNQAWDIQLASYQREIERYGINTISTAETFFLYDSEQIIAFISNTKDDETRFLALFKWLECMISLFDFKDSQLLSFLQNMQEKFKEEFTVDKNVRKELGIKYRKLESQLSSKKLLLFLQETNLKKVINIFLSLEKEQKLTISLENLLASFIHMSINRCFQSKQRLHEMMLYDFLYRKNKSKFARYGRL